MHCVKSVQIQSFYSGFVFILVIPFRKVAACKFFSVFNLSSHNSDNIVFRTSSQVPRDLPNNTLTDN